ncbi:MAG: hypothetical protein ACRCV9_08735 [Burkholderiaceae bacterium]
MSEPRTQLAALQTGLAHFMAGHIDAASLAKVCRGNADITTQLPGAFATVLDDIVIRLESGAMFSEESCSFSQDDLVNELQVWLEKAQQKLAVKQGA